MPHCIVEYSENSLSQVNETVLLDTVFATLSASELFAEANINTRLQPCRYAKLGSGHSGFIHVTIRLFAGRSEQDKAKLTQQVGDALALLPINNSVISCECVEIDKATLHRRLID